jgi:hypothetical protein
MSLAAVLRASSLSQLSTVREIRYSSRSSTTRDHVMITWSQRTPAHHPCDEFWHATGTQQLIMRAYQCCITLSASFRKIVSQGPSPGPLFAGAWGSSIRWPSGSMVNRQASVAG